MTNGSIDLSLDLLSGASGYLVIDSRVRNTSSGGVRISEDLERDEVRALAREMTLKYAFCGLPRGGAKSGIRLPEGCTPALKQGILEDFGRKIGHFIRSGLYWPGMDMNCGPADLRLIYRGAGIALERTTDTSWYTALSLANAVEACAEYLGKRDRPATLAVEGFGSVAAHLATMLDPSHFRFAAVSTAEGAALVPEGTGGRELRELRSRYGDAFVVHIPGGVPIEKSALLTLPVDLLIPAARTWTVHSGNAGEVCARAVVPAANAPYTEEIIDQLQERGVICLPGFVTNAGGVFASSLADSGVHPAQIEELCRTLYRRVVLDLLAAAGRTGTSPVRIAEAAARRRLEEGRENGLGAWGVRLLKNASRRGLFPRAAYGRIYLRHFSEELRRIDTLLAQGGGALQ